MAARYHLVTRLELSTEPKRVWGALVQINEWPTWWKWLQHVEIVDRGNADGLGSVFRQSITSPLLYGFTWETEIVRLAEPSLIELESSGDLNGRGQFQIIDALHGGTDFQFTWLVETGKRWMNLLAPLGRPAFTWAHDRLMTDFGIGLASATGADLVEVSHEAVAPGVEGFYRLPEVVD